jgi:glycosyltransferase involved in cell wall biosynthesis
LKIAGTGSQLDSLKKQAESVGNIEFLGFVSESRKAELMSSSLFFIIPSLIEGYVTTGLEALASGTPVIGSDVPGINDYIVHKENGFLFPKDDPVALSRTLKTALSNPEDARSMAEAGQELAQKHSFENFSEEADSVFSKLVTNDAPHRREMYIN